MNERIKLLAEQPGLIRFVGVLQQIINRHRNRGILI